MSALSRFVLCLPCVLYLCCRAFAQQLGLPDLPISWFEEPDRHAPHWNVAVSPARLTYSQRFLVSVETAVPANEKGPRSEWQLVLRVADENGKWFENSEHFRLDLRPIPSGVAFMLWQVDAVVRPGTYRFALLAYDTVNQEHFVWHKVIRVNTPSILPDLDRDLPKVEFVNPDQDGRPIPEYLPVHTSRPVRIDVVFNLTGNLQLSMTPNEFESFRHHFAESALRGSIAVLPQLAPSRGCVRVSAIDILRLKVALDRSGDDPASNLDRIGEAIPTVRDNATVDVHTLAGRTKARAFFHDFLKQVIDDNSGCGPNTPAPVRAVIVVSDSLIFPEGADSEPGWPPDNRIANFFHVRFSYTRFGTSVSMVLLGGQIAHDPTESTFDELGRMLGPLHPRHFDVADPKGLRRAVAEIVRRMEASSVVSERALATP